MGSGFIDCAKPTKWSDYFARDLGAMSTRSRVRQNPYTTRRGNRSRHIRGPFSFPRFRRKREQIIHLPQIHTSCQSKLLPRPIARRKRECSTNTSADCGSRSERVRREQQETAGKQRERRERGKLSGECAHGASGRSLLIKRNQTHDRNYTWSTSAAAAAPRIIEIDK